MSKQERIDFEREVIMFLTDEGVSYHEASKILKAAARRASVLGTGLERAGIDEALAGR